MYEDAPSHENRLNEWQSFHFEELVRLANELRDSLKIPYPADEVRMIGVNPAYKWPGDLFAVVAQLYLNDRRIQFRWGLQGR